MKILSVCHVMPVRISFLDEQGDECEVNGHIDYVNNKVWIKDKDDAFVQEVMKFLDEKHEHLRPTIPMPENFNEAINRSSDLTNKYKSKGKLEI